MKKKVCSIRVLYDSIKKIIASDEWKSKRMKNEGERKYFLRELS